MYGDGMMSDDGDGKRQVLRFKLNSFANVQECSGEVGWCWPGKSQKKKTMGLIGRLSKAQGTRPRRDT